MSVLCPQCGAPVNETTGVCDYCGTSAAKPAAQPQQVSTAQHANMNIEQANLPVKSKIVAGILALLIGGLGIHKFYLGQAGKGILYILFCWTYIPLILSVIEGITILCSDDAKFQAKYKCRIG